MNDKENESSLGELKDLSNSLLDATTTASKGKQAPPDDKEQKMHFDISVEDYQSMLRDQVAQKLFLKIVAVITLAGGILTGTFHYVVKWQLEDKVKAETDAEVASNLPGQLAYMLVMSQPFQQQIGKTVATYFNGTGQAILRDRITAAAHAETSNLLENAQEQIRLSVSNAVAQQTPKLQAVVASNIDFYVPEFLKSGVGQTAVRSAIDGEQTRNEIIAIVLTNQDFQKAIGLQLSGLADSLAQEAFDEFADGSDSGGARLEAAGRIRSSICATEQNRAKLFWMMENEPTISCKAKAFELLRPTSEATADTDYNKMLEILTKKGNAMDGDSDENNYIDDYEMGVAAAISHFGKDPQLQASMKWLADNPDNSFRHAMLMGIGKNGSTNGLAKIIDVIESDRKDNSKQSFDGWYGLQEFPLSKLTPLEQIRWTGVVWGEFKSDLNFSSGSDSGANYRQVETSGKAHSTDLPIMGRTIQEDALQNILSPLNWDAFKLLVHKQIRPRSFKSYFSRGA